MKRNNVIKLIQPSPAFSESAVLLQNFAQILDAVVSKHGAKITLEACQSMILDAQRKASTQKTIPRRRASNG